MTQLSDRRRLIGNSLTVAGALLLVALAIWLDDDNDTLAVQTADQQQEIAQLRPVADQALVFTQGVIALCAAGTPEAVEMRRLGYCRQAIEIAQAAPTIQPASGVSRTEILELVRQVVRETPPSVPVAQVLPEIERMVREQYAENAPTADELLPLVQQVYLENPPPAGEQGDQGDPGDPGDPGAQGFQGPGVVDVDRRVREDGGCDLVFFLFNPSTGETREDVVPLPISCEEAPPPTTTEPPPPTTTVEPTDPPSLLPGG